MVVIRHENMTIINDSFRVLLQIAASLCYDHNSQLYIIIVASRVINYDSNRVYNYGITDNCHLRP
jgi:hypothetical protein